MSFPGLMDLRKIGHNGHEFDRGGATNLTLVDLILYFSIIIYNLYQFVELFFSISLKTLNLFSNKEKIIFI